MAKKAHVLIFDGYADWEPALLLAELRREGGYEIRAVGFGAGPATSMGGLRVEVDESVSDLSAADVELLIVPGADRWEAGDYPQDDVHALLGAVEASGGVVAGICGGTVALARAGLLDGRKHTSNFADFLTKSAPHYAGAAHYVDEMSVRDRRVVTANGLGGVDFARDVLAETNVYPAETLAAWYDAFKHGRYSAAAG